MGKRRAKRIPCDLTITLTAEDEESGEMLAGPLEGRIVDISPYGAGLVLPQIMSKAFHMFHTTRERDTSFLQLIVQAPANHDNLSLQAHPVWMDIQRQDTKQAFIMGVEFTFKLEKDRLHEILH